jgi:hypothetical protein
MIGRIPTDSDWRSEPWCLDIPYAYEHFAGKSQLDAVELFKQNAICYQEDLMHMPRACFPYYASAYITYLMSDISEGDSDGASCFFGLVECRAKEIRANDILADSVVACLERLADGQDFFGADPAIYGSFSERAEKARRELQWLETGD